MDHHETLLSLTILATIDPQGSTVLVIILLVLLLLSFLLSGSEVAFFSLNYKDINLLKTKQQPAYKRIIDLLEQPKILLASLRIANVFVKITIIIIANILIDSFVDFDRFTYFWVALLTKVAIVGSAIIFFAEVLPKVLATQNNIRFAKEVGPVIEAMSYFFMGLSKWMVVYSEWVEKKLTNTSNAGTYSLAELDYAIDLATDSAAAEKEKNILKGIVKFGNISVKQIMTGRIDVSGLETHLSFFELLDRVAELHYSRLPVFDEDLDNIVGLIHTKDLVPFLTEATDFDWHAILRKPLFIHEHKMIEDLLKEFQSKHIHFAIVVDEFGGTSGIVTMEDILEEIIGDIRDEFDEEEIGYKKIDEYNFVFDGKTMINDVCRVMELNPDTFDPVKGDSDTLAGLVLEIAGDIPSTNQAIVSGDFEFTPIEIVKNRVQKVRVSIKIQISG